MTLSSLHSEGVKQINWEFAFPFIYSASTPVSAYISLPYAPNALPRHRLFLTDNWEKRHSLQVPQALAQSPQHFRHIS